MLVRQAVLCAGADINRLPTKAIKLLADVGFSSSTRYRFVAQNDKLLHLGIRRWYKKPLPLSNARCVAAAVAILRPKSALAALDEIGLESLFSISNATYRRSFRNAGNKPVALIMAKQEAVLLSTTAAQQQQVTVDRLNIQNHQFSSGRRRTRNLEVFSVLVSTHIERQVIRSNPAREPTPPIQLTKFNSHSHSCESAFQHIHISSNLRAIARLLEGWTKNVQPHQHCKFNGQGTCGYGRAFAQEDSNLTARRLFLPEKYPSPITTDRVS